MRTFSFIAILVIFVSIFPSCDRGDDPRAEITVIDPMGRPVPNARVEIFSRPTNLILEDQDFTDEVGKTYHEFLFEGTLDVEAYIVRFSNFSNLSGVGEINLKRDETYKTTITLSEPLVVEEED